MASRFQSVNKNHRLGYNPHHVKPSPQYLETLRCYCKVHPCDEKGLAEHKEECHTHEDEEAEADDPFEIESEDVELLLPPREENQIELNIVDCWEIEESSLGCVMHLTSKEEIEQEDKLQAIVNDFNGTSAAEVEAEIAAELAEKEAPPRRSSNDIMIALKKRISYRKNEPKLVKTALHAIDKFILKDEI